MSAELTVNSSTCLTSRYDLSVDRKLNESQTGDSTHLLMHSASNVTWSLWIIPADIRTPACLVHSIPDKPPTSSCLNYTYFNFRCYTKNCNIKLAFWADYCCQIRWLHISWSYKMSIPVAQKVTIKNLTLLFVLCYAKHDEFIAFKVTSLMCILTL